MGLFGGGKKKTAKTTSTALPYAPQIPYINRSFSYGQQAYNNSAPDADTNAAYNRLIQRGTNGSPLVDQAKDYTSRVLSGQYLNGNPYLDNVTNSVATSARGAVNSNYAAAGRYGSGAHDGAVARQVGDVVGQIRFNDYNNQLGRIDQAAQFAPTLAQTDYIDANAALDAANARRYDQFQRAGLFKNVISGNYGGTQTNSQKYKKPGLGQQLIGGALSLGGSALSGGLFGGF